MLAPTLLLSFSFSFPLFCLAPCSWRYITYPSCISGGPEIFTYVHPYMRVYFYLLH